MADSHAQSERSQTKRVDCEIAPPGLFSRRHWAYWGLTLLGDPEALPYPVRYPEVEWEWPASFQDNHPPKPTTADDINWIAPA